MINFDFIALVKLNAILSRSSGKSMEMIKHKSN